MHLADIPFPQSAGWQRTNNAGINRVIGWGMLLLLLVANPTAQSQTEFEWRDASGHVRSLSELKEILREHRQWIESGGKRAKTAAEALQHLIELGKNAGRQADLERATLTMADLGGANLSGANLVEANLTKANLSSAILTDANLLDANLTDTKLIEANLSGAYLAEANLTGAWVAGANFDRAVFEPNLLPPVVDMSRAKNLELLTYNDNPAALVQLRQQFEDGGFREQERKITYALKRHEAELSWARGTSRKLPREHETRPILSSSDSVLANFASFTLNKLFFDWTCQYGMSPGRPLLLGVVLWLLCSLLYFVCIHTPGEAGLYRVYGKGIRDTPSTQQRVEKISSRRTTRSRGSRWLFQVSRRECLLLRTSMFFSLMSAFNIGFRDINFGRWLRLLTRQEFDIKAVGWARVIAGWQSLISVFLIALWVLTYFGRPFE